MLHNLSFIRSQPYMCSSSARCATVTRPGTGNLGSKLFSNVRNSLSSTIVNGLRPLATHATSRSRLRLYSLELLFQLANWAMTVPSARLVRKDGLPTRYPWLRCQPCFVHSVARRSSHAPKKLYMRACTYICIHAYVCMYVHNTHVHTYLYTYIYSHIHS